MKINGVDPTTLTHEEILVLPKGSTQLVFRARGVKDMSGFNALVPEPKPPLKLQGGVMQSDLNEPGYAAAMKEYAKRHYAYLVVHSLEPTNIEWDSVKLDVPGTWALWEDDLKNANLTQVECNLVFQLVMAANQLDEAKLQRARESFLLGLTLESGK